mgnify:CR=1 FL=1
MNNFPVDAVYLWCDGGCPEFASEQKLRRKQYDKLCNKELTVEMIRYLDFDNRFTDHDELKYSLRSLAKHAPWIRHIFIVTNKQRPRWLNDNSRVTIVDHSEIIPSNILPTFNSCTIEQYIVNIKGLSEHFIYLNDDMFFYKDTPKSIFFEGKKPIVYLKKAHRAIKSYEDAIRVKKSSSPYMKSVLNGLFIMKDHGRPFIEFRWNTHCIDSYSKTILNKIFKDYPEVYDLNSQPFRNENEVARVFWLWEMAFFRECPLRIEVKSNSLWQKFLIACGLREAFTFEFQSQHNRNNSYEKFVLNLERLNPYHFCCNNLTGCLADEVMSYLEKKFPEKSVFEK